MKKAITLFLLCLLIINKSLFATNVIVNSYSSLLSAVNGTVDTIFVDGSIMLSSEIIINRNLVFIGISNGTLDGNYAQRLMSIKPLQSKDSISVSIINLKLTKGNGNNGGAIYNVKSNLFIKKSIFIHNKSMSDPHHYVSGGAIYNVDGKVYIDSTHITDTNCGDGAIYNDGGEILMANCDLNNTSTVGIINLSGTVSVINSILHKNSSMSAIYGSAIHNYGTFNLINTLIFNNKSGYTIYNNGLMNILNCTVAGNHPAGYSAICQGDKIMNAKNSIFLANDMIKNDYVREFDIKIYNGVSNFEHCIFGSLAGLLDKNINSKGNASAVDVFVDHVNYDFQLKKCGIAINSGSNLLYINEFNRLFHDSISSPSVHYDIDGNVRMAGGVIDIGAFESEYLAKQIFDTICSGEIYDFYGQMIDSSGVYLVRIPSLNECDSDLIYLNLIVNSVFSQNESLGICENELPYAWRDTVFDPGTVSGNYVFSRRNINGCDSIVTLNLSVYDEAITNLTDVVEQGESYKKYNFDLPVQNIAGIFTFTQNLQTVNGCDSTVMLKLTVAKALKIEFRPLAEICGDDQMFTIEYDVLAGEIDSVLLLFDKKEQTKEFVYDSLLSVIGKNIVVRLPLNVRPNDYSMKIIFEGSGLQKEFTLDFTVLYPSSIIEQKWNDVLALLNERFNGGYVFSDYEWYKNGNKILGSTASYLYVGPYDMLDFTAEYRVLITRIDDDVKLFTCPVTPSLRKEEKQYPTLVNANQYFPIEISGTGKTSILNMSGFIVSEQNLTDGNNQILAPSLSGYYVMMIITDDLNNRTKQILIVK